MLFLFMQETIGPADLDPANWVSPWVECCDLWSLPDINQDGDVDKIDLFMWTNLANPWPRPCAGPEDYEGPPYCCRPDLNKDGWVDILDLEILAKWYWAEEYDPSAYYDWACSFGD